MYIGLRVKYPSFLTDFNEKSSFAKNFLEIHIYQYSRKSGQWKPNFSTRTDRRTDMKNLKLLFAIFSNAPRNEIK